MKKMSLILAAILCLMQFTAVAAGITTVELNAAENNGEIVLTASITDNVGFAGFDFAVTFDNKAVTPVSINKGEVTKAFSLTSNLQQNIDFSGLEKVTACVFNAGNINGNGTLFSVIFKRIDDNADVQFDLSYKPSDILNENLKAVDIKVINNTIKNIENEVIAPAEQPTEQPAEQPDEGFSGNTGGTVTSKPKPPEATKAPSEQSKPAAATDAPNEQTTPISFNDVQKTDWFYDSVKWGYENSLITGISETQFAPYNTVTRAMLVTMLYRYSESRSSFGGTIFADVTANDWYYNAVMWAYKNKIVNGVGNGKFAPNDSITREQAAKILYEFAKTQKINTEINLKTLEYSDSEKISDWAYDAMLWAVQNKFINGRSESLLEPLGKANRAEIITILKRFLEK